ncbi:otoferlin-like isoform X2, partial [Dinothrombium tinctorium]
SFYWALTNVIQADDYVQIQVFLHNRYLTKRLIGLYYLELDDIVNQKSRVINDFLCNFERQPVRSKIKFDVQYITPESGPLEEQIPIVEIENVHEEENLLPDGQPKLECRGRSSSVPEKNVKTRFKHRAITFSTTAVKSIGKTLGISRKNSDALRSPETASHSSERSRSDGRESVSSFQSDVSLLHTDIASMDAVPPEINEMIIDIEKINKILENEENSDPITTPVFVKRLSEVYDLLPTPPRAQFYQVSITIIEAQELPGTNLNPFVVIQVNDQKKQTTVKESTSSPYFNEFFAFDFNATPTILLDKIITLTVYHSRNILRHDKMIGSFKLDIGTVFKQEDHQFYHKWAILTDSDDLRSTVKGYLKCDIAVIGKGYNALTSSARSAGEDSEESILDNLLLPPTISAERPASRFMINIYRADGLPRYSTGLISTMKKKLSSLEKQIINPFVVVSFAGLTVKTKVCKENRNPVWNEQIIFYELFPPLFQKIKIEIRDSQTGNDGVIATHYLSLSSISNDGAEGFLPTFGPSFLHFYGSLIGYDEGDKKTTEFNANGVCYRGRLLLSVATEILDSDEPIPKGLTEVKSIPPVNESVYGNVKDFLAFVSIFSSSMLPKKYGEKKICYEISVGNPFTRSDDPGVDTDLEREKLLEDIAEEPEIEESTKEKVKAETNNCARTKQFKSLSSGKNSYYLPMEEEKPCLYVTTSWPDNRRRVYSYNVLTQIADNLELGILDVEEMIKMEREGAERRMKGVFEELLFGCNRYLALTIGSGGSAGGKTKLDKERIRIIQRGIERIAQDVHTSNLIITKSNLKEKLKLARFYLGKIREVSEDPQHGIPDVFLWMVVNGKKVAFSRLLAKNYLFSLIKDESGKYCGKHDTIYFQVPGKPNYEVVNKLDAYVWFGLLEHKAHFTKGLPSGYQNVPEIRFADDMTLPPPKSLIYMEKHVFQLRAHLYQARSLIAADDSGLSDPYAKVFYGNHCLHTHVVNETLNPIWDEMLLFTEITLYGRANDLRNTVPWVIIEIYDEDKRGTDDFIGRALAEPSIRFAEEQYSLPKLGWFDLWRGCEDAGQLLGAFELIQLSENDEEEDYPKTLQISPKTTNSGQAVYSVPYQIKPVMSKYHLEVLFWGVRDLKRIQFSSIDRPRVDIECCGSTLSSTTIANYKKNQNFEEPLKSIELKLPDQDIYCPPITIRVVDCRSFGRHVLVGCHTIKSIFKYIYKEDSTTLPTLRVLMKQEINIDPKLHFAPEVPKEEKKDAKKKEMKEKKEEVEQEVIDWWSRYYASKEAMNRHHKDGITREKVPPHMHLKILSCEIERAYESPFESLQLFELTRGKQDPNEEDDNSRSVGYFRGSLCLYKLPLTTTSVFEMSFVNEPVKVMVRVYIVRATDLSPTDIGGKSDPYIVIVLGDRKVSDRDHYISNQLNPVFGRCFEFEATFPQDCFLAVQIKDFDLIGQNELIGETKIDLEARYYSYQRFICGLQKTYETSGPNKWRDSVKPSFILGQQAKFLKATHSIEKNKVKIGNVVFTFVDLEAEKQKMMNEPRKQQKLVLQRKKSEQVEIVIDEKPLDPEQMCLAVLHNWKEAFGYSLCSEHVETRPLYHPDKPGVERGQIEMWIDMFPTDLPQPPPPTDITPRKPISYELRVIIWNTDEVILEDSNALTGEKMSDIYVKGWLTDSNESQSTDVHYRSLTGEGNFNWRFIFPFDYAPPEEKIIIAKKESLFSWDETETKIPPKLYLQVWDADLVSADDFLGALTLDLNNFVRGAKTSLSCTMDMITKANELPKISIFTHKRVKGWWPFFDKTKEGETILTGKVEAEIHLLTKEEAEASPAGLGRNEPDPLDKPNRPETSFMWFMNPFKTLRYVIWRNFKSKILKAIFFIFLALFILLFVYAAPGLTARRLFDAI